MTPTHLLRPVLFLVAAIALALPPAADAADPIKVGPEILVDDGYANYMPRVASDAAGNFMVIWEGEYSNVMARRFYANGGEQVPTFQLSDPDHYLGSGGSTSTGNIGVAGDAAGNFVVTYGATNYEYIYYGYPKCYGQPCVWTRRNDANGNTAPPTFVIQDPTQTYVYAYFQNDQVSNPEIAGLGNGEFVVAWEGYDKYPRSSGGFGSDESAFGSKTVSIGQKKGQSFRVNTIADQYQGQYGDLAAAGDAEGNFVIAFRSEYYYYEGSGLPFPGGNIRAQLFNKNGKKVGTEFGTSISDSTGGYNLDIAQAPDGTFMVIWQESGVFGRIFNGDGTPVTDDFEVYGSLGEYPVISASDDSFVVAWTGNYVMAQRFDLAGTELSGEFRLSTTDEGYSVDIAAAANGNFVATWKDDTDGRPRAQRFQIEAATPEEHPLYGNVVVLTNKLPDNPEKAKGKWKAKGENLTVPPRGTDDDPRCNGDPEGTVKAVLRIWSDDSGHDTGAIALPCQHWSVTGGNSVGAIPKRGYKYKDNKLDSGPCNSVKIKGTKSLAVSCKGKPGVMTFPYDLEVGTSEVAVNTLLELGLYRYCSYFPSAGFDGSDGKKFLGRKADAPLAPCPVGFLGQCGNSVIGIDEVCDDGNTDDGDYCSADCKRITSVCGDGAIELEEVCDDGNTLDGDYCNADCTAETAVCGDSLIGPGEACDDGNTVGGDYCSANCSTITAVCGDSVIGPGEACDDGNTVGGDYCSADCSTETAICGDGLIGPGEACDDGNTSGGDYCSADCLTETAICGDGVVSPGEVCDDGNTLDGDLCSSDCLEAFAICGDGILGPGECCDDGNTSGGDGCDATCDGGSLCPSGAALFTNSIFVHYNSTPCGTAFSNDHWYEARNLECWMVDRGHTYTAFTATDAAGITSATVGQHALFLPEFERADLEPNLNSAAKTAIRDYVDGGGNLIVFGHSSGRNLRLVNSVFGYLIARAASCHSSGASDIAITGEAAGTVFAGGPATLPLHSCTTTLSKASLPPGTASIYEISPTESALAVIPYGSGTIVILGWDWYNAWPVGSFSGDGVTWIDVLDRAWLLP